ncbi:MAG: outer membrane protein transport protein [Bacteroidota bacterium]
MKRISTVLMVLLCATVSAQSINEVLRYSINEPYGTARFRAMGGAFGALGGDLSALNVNPAGSAVFNFGEFTVTGSNYNRDNEASLGGRMARAEINSQEINQAGAVFVFESNNSNWKKLAVGVNFDMVQNFDNETFISGTANNGIDNYFLQQADGFRLADLRVQADNGERIEDAYLNIGETPGLGFAGQQAFLGFQAGLIEPTEDVDDNDTYFSNAIYDNVNQELLTTTSGFNSKLTLNFAGQYQENLYVGASLNFHTVLFEQLTLFDENGYADDSPVTFTTFDNFLRTDGYGFSFSVGAIAKLNDNIRIGGSYQSPTWYELTDEISQRINSTLAEPDINFINFGLVNLFEEYRIQTPSIITGSAAVVFGKEGLISFDYSYQDMSQAELRPNSDPIFIEENDFIENTLGVINTYRIGGELRIDQLSLRAGYRLEESPYENGEVIGDLTGYSGGLGYNFGGSRLDLAFVRTDRDVSQNLFDSDLSDAAMVNQVNTTITLGYTLKF